MKLPDPVAFRLGPLAIRWYGVMMALSVGLGCYYLVRQGRRQGFKENQLYDIVLVSVLGGIVGARLVYVVTNWSAYASAPWSVLRTDWGGLSFHGAFLGGLLAGWLYLRRHRLPFGEIADLTIPGFCAGIFLVRLANILNQEVMGRVTASGFQHPAQLYGAAIGPILFILYLVQSRRKLPPGYRFWSFALYYSVWRGLVEETFRANPLYVWGYVYEPWGAGWFTLTHLLTPVFIGAAWHMRKRLSWGKKR